MGIWSVKTFTAFQSEKVGKYNQSEGRKYTKMALFENKRNRDVLLPLLSLLQFLSVGLKVPLWVVTLFEPPPLLRFVCFAGTSR